MHYAPFFVIDKDNIPQNWISLLSIYTSKSFGYAWWKYCETYIFCGNPNHVLKIKWCLIYMHIFRKQFKFAFISAYFRTFKRLFDCGDISKSSLFSEMSLEGVPDSRTTFLGSVIVSILVWYFYVLQGIFVILFYE